MTISKTQVDLCQGQDDQYRDFGYVAGDADGGFFFTWRESLEETIDSIEEDDCGDGGLAESDVISLLKSHLPTTAKGRLMWGDSYDFSMDY